MANDISSDRLWIFTHAQKVVEPGEDRIVRRIIFNPEVAGQEIVIKEYVLDGSEKIAIELQANSADTDPVTIDFGKDGRRLNGFHLSKIEGGKLYVYLGRG